ncbi:MULTISPECIES: phenylacetaldoxime dehydratase family protein [unclassified Pseudomonas]|uniref:aliphatic aldoxime dehydratase n=1 Tax=unclassified Pseudomonas TaxID=196821 RepID=UPI000C8777D8|nr:MULTISPECIES: phenylacetaldoxime dehydratase family protein [unclassified Pseudomonas]PMU12410.1 phenylacetaldoxime dehydratase [Pseudomonas sp. FW305-20]PMU14036.1 phenylacetaldoxime dehydratase [Pseudomonas sp. FW305-122]PMU36771.1 phenylacetaldoxime dehydratase [Pseudomonas sp. FW305-47B]PMX56879.1 phenylacetaldoxime dehydratase [Pseudomonas sp. FW305-33]PMX60776.1 phenylacetaldoxime dehydratase [Pseudomonas sp. FW305-60]
MESAIDKHLKCPRTLSRRVPDEYQPPFPMWVGRADEQLEQVVMGYWGVQYRGEDQRAAALHAMRHIAASLGLPDGPLSHDLTHHTDNSGYDNLMIVGYWKDPAAYCRWLRTPEVSQWWSSEDRLNDGLGYFREIVAPRAEQFETLYGFRDELPGLGAVMDTISDDIEEHGYWGSMRDRFPISQTDWMAPSGELTVIAGDPAKGGRVVVQGHDNIALIRSGQDWADAGEEERSLYLNEILPTLQAGMDFLRDSGKDLGCYSNRFVNYIDLDGNLLNLSYNIGHWRSLEKLERWAESHPTHLRIFVTFFRVATSLSKLRLYHEVSVSDAKDQVFEYINCHPQTGMLRDAVIPKT